MGPPQQIIEVPLDGGIIYIRDPNYGVVTIKKTGPNTGLGDVVGIRIDKDGQVWVIIATGIGLLPEYPVQTPVYIPDWLLK